MIGCGSYQPIDMYAAKSASAYPIYTDPSLRLHGLFRFKYNLAEGKSGDEQRDYMRNAGSALARILGGIKGALGSIQHVTQVGPKALNGGEVVISAGESVPLSIYIRKAHALLFPQNRCRKEKRKSTDMVRV